MKEKVQRYFERYGNFVGDNGLARLELANICGRTAIRTLRTKAPLLVQKALYPYAPEMAFVILMSSSGGVLAGDRIEIDVTAGRGTASRITTQAASKIYRMDRGFAAQTIAIVVQEASYMEFLPHQIIPYRSSRFFQHVDARIDHTATFLYSETLVGGRTAAGEAFDFDLCFLKMKVSDPSGKVLFSDAAKLEPGKDEMKWLFGGKSIWSTLYVVMPEFEGIKKQTDSEIKRKSLLAGTSVLPHDCGFVMRMLDDSIDSIRELTESIATTARRHSLSSALAGRTD